jgi:hypothetical protein
MLELYTLSHEDLWALRTFVRALFDTPRRSDRAPRRLSHGRYLPAPQNGAAERRHGFRSYLGDLAAAVEDWFSSGVEVSPIFAERVQLLLQRSGQLAWERAFLAIYLDHFAESHTGPHSGLIRRAAELRAFPLRRHSRSGAPRNRPRLRARA